MWTSWIQLCCLCIGVRQAGVQGAVYWPPDGARGLSRLASDIQDSASRYAELPASVLSGASSLNSLSCLPLVRRWSLEAVARLYLRWIIVQLEVFNLFVFLSWKSLTYSLRLFCIFILKITDIHSLIPSPPLLDQGPYQAVTMATLDEYTRLRSMAFYRWFFFFLISPHFYSSATAK